MESGFELQLLSAYVDGALSAPKRRTLEARIEQDPTLRSEVQALRRLRMAIQMNAERYPAPDALRARISAMAAQGVAKSVRRFDWRRWIDWRPLVLGLALTVVAATGLNTAIWRPEHAERLLQAAVTSHLQATTGRRMVDIASPDPGTLQPWLAARLAFTAPVLTPASAEATLLGGRLDSLEGRSVAAVVYRLRDHIVSTFVWPIPDDDESMGSASVRGFSVSHWSHGGLRYCVVSDLPRGQLLAFAQALAQADKGR